MRAVVIGAGFSGLQASLALKRAGVKHMVLEKSPVTLRTWREERWDSFGMNTPHWSNRMLGQTDSMEDDAVGYPVSKCLELWDAFLSTQDLPVHLNCHVTQVKPAPDNQGYTVEWKETDGTSHSVETPNVFIACGALQQVKVPSFASNLPEQVRQFTLTNYKNPTQLAPGPVLVVGSAQTGVQIADEFLKAGGRDVYLATSQVACVPRSFRGRELIGLMRDLGVLYTPRDQLPPEQVAKPTPPQIGASYSITFHLLARQGAKLLGRLEGVSDDGKTATFGDQLAAHVAFSDATSEGLLKKLEAGTQAHEKFKDLPPNPPDPAFEKFPELDDYEAPRSLPLGEGGITNIFWATGLDVSYPWLQIPGLESMLDANKYPKGPTFDEEAPGVYFVGFYNQRSMASNFLHGMTLDSEWAVNHMLQKNANQ